MDNLDQRKKKITLGLVGAAIIVGIILVVITLIHPTKRPAQTKEVTYPLNDNLPVQTSDYQITYSYSPATKQFYYVVTLYALINRPSQYPAYVAQLKQYKKEALDYIRSKGGDPSKMNLEILPPEAAQL